MSRNVIRRSRCVVSSRAGVSLWHSLTHTVAFVSQSHPLSGINISNKACARSRVKYRSASKQRHSSASRHRCDQTHRKARAFGGFVYRRLVLTTVVLRTCMYMPSMPVYTCTVPANIPCTCHPAPIHAYHSLLYSALHTMAFSF